MHSSNGASTTPRHHPYRRQLLRHERQPFQAIFRAPSLEGGLFISAAAFVSDALTVGDR